MKLLSPLIALMLVALNGPIVFAEGGNSGGGGVFIELDVLAVRTFLAENCDHFESFKRHKVDCSEFTRKIDEVGPLGKGLSIKRRSLHLEDGKAVDAINYQPAKVEIGEPAWESAGADVALKVGLQAHEFLSLMKLEHTGYYVISKDLVNELRTSGQFASRPKGLSWLRSQFSGPHDSFRQLHGRDSISGKPCGLYLSNLKAALGPREDYYVVVALDIDTQNDDDYIGVVASQTVGSMSDRTLHLDSDQSWGNDTKYNKIKIKINLFGEPISIAGESDKRQINCVLNPSKMVESK